MDKKVRISNRLTASFVCLLDSVFLTVYLVLVTKQLKNVKDAGYNGVIIYNAKLTQLNVPEMNCEFAPQIFGCFFFCLPNSEKLISLFL